MTLIVASSFPSVTVIQSDGRMKKNGNVESDICQKIFPIAGTRIAISHSGIRDNGKMSIVDTLTSISFSKAQCKFDVALLLAKEISAIVDKGWCRCPRCQAARQSCTLMVHGYDKTNDRNSFELLWDYLTDKPKLTPKTDWGWAHGSGHTSVRWIGQPATQSVADVGKFVDSLFSSAIQSTDDNCGGHTHALAIEEYCYWITPPASDPVQLE